MYLMLRPDPDTLAEAGSAAERDELGEFRRLDSNQDNQDQNLMSCQLLHAGRRRVKDRRGVASTIPSHPQTLVLLQSAPGKLPGREGSYGVAMSSLTEPKAARAQPSIRRYRSA